MGGVGGGEEKGKKIVFEVNSNTLLFLSPSYAHHTI